MESEVNRAIEAFRKPFSKLPEMRNVVAYGEARPLDIGKEIRHATVGYLQIVKQIAHMPETDVELIRQAEKLMGDSQNGASKGTQAFFEKIGPQKRNLVSIIASAIHPDSPRYQKTVKQLTHLMNNAQKISDEEMKLEKKDGVRKFDRSIWGYRNIKSNEGQIHATIGHFMSQALFKAVKGHWEKDDLLAAMTDQIIIDHFRHPDKSPTIFDLWRKKKTDGGLGWISDKRFDAFKQIFEKNQEIGRQLQDQLQTFASADNDEQREQLPGLIAFIQEHATINTVLPLVKKNTQWELEHAMNRAWQTPVDARGEEINPWTHTGTVVAMDADGRICAAVSYPPDDLTPYVKSGERPKFNFIAPALVKAVTSLHLQKARLSGGIGDNGPYLDEIFGRKFPYHMGATNEPVEMGNERQLILGASGCEATSTFISKTIDGGQPTHFTNAGAMDEAFAGITAIYLSQPEINPQSIQSPVVDQLLMQN